MKYAITACLLLTVAHSAFADEPKSAASAIDKEAAASEAKFLANIHQVTFGLPRAGEGYFSPDGTEIVYQAYPVGYPFYQIYYQKLDERVPRRISPGRGRTTCSYFSPDGKQILFASAHANPNLPEIELKARKLAAAGVTMELLGRVARADHLGRTTPDACAGQAGPIDAFLRRAAELEALHESAPDVVKGRHLIARGLEPGVHFGEILTACRDVQDETGSDDPDEILRIVLGSRTE